MTHPVQARDLLRQAAQRQQAQRDAIKEAAADIAQARMDELAAQSAEQRPQE